MCEIFLVIGFGAKEGRRGREFGDDRRLLPVRRAHLGADRVGDRLLLVGVVEDRGTILRSGVIPLPIGGGRIVNSEKELAELAIRDLAWIELHVDHLCMSRVARANVLVGRVLLRAAEIADADRLQLRELLPIPFLHTPKTTTTKSSKLCRRRRRR